MSGFASIACLSWLSLFWKHQDPWQETLELPRGYLGIGIGIGLGCEMLHPQLDYLKVEAVPLA